MKAHEVAQDIINVRESIEAFFDKHGLRLGLHYFGGSCFFKRCVSKQPFSGISVNPTSLGAEEASSMKCAVENSGILDFIKKQHIIATQLLRSRSYSLTDYNLPELHINSLSPYSLRNLSDLTRSHVDEMQDILKDPSFTGIWVSLHTKPFLLAGSDLVRNKIVCWSLIELLDGDEKQLTAFWSHPCLSASSTAFLLKAFVLYVMLEASEASLEENSVNNSSNNVAKGSLFLWLYQLSIFPRPCMLLLLDDRFIGLRLHFDIRDGYPHSEEGYPPQRSCSCKTHVKSSKSKAYFSVMSNTILSRIGFLRAMIYSESSPNPRLLDDLHCLGFESPDECKKFPAETKEEVHEAEFVGAEASYIQDVLESRFGQEGRSFLKVPFR